MSLNLHTLMHKKKKSFHLGYYIVKVVCWSPKVQSGNSCVMKCFSFSIFKTRKPRSNFFLTLNFMLPNKKHKASQIYLHTQILEWLESRFVHHLSKFLSLANYKRQHELKLSTKKHKANANIYLLAPKSLNYSKVDLYVIFPNFFLFLWITNLNMNLDL